MRYFKTLNSNHKSLLVAPNDFSAHIMNIALGRGDERIIECDETVYDHHIFRVWTQDHLVFSVERIQQDSDICMYVSGADTQNHFEGPYLMGLGDDENANDLMSKIKISGNFPFTHRTTVPLTPEMFANVKSWGFIDVTINKHHVVETILGFTSERDFMSFRLAS